MMVAPNWNTLSWAGMALLKNLFILAVAFNSAQTTEIRHYPSVILIGRMPCLGRFDKASRHLQDNFDIPAAIGKIQ